MNENGFDVYAASADGKEVEELVLREGVSHHVIPFTRKITPIKDLWCVWKLVRLIRKIKPDIVHTHTPKAGLIGMISAWLCGVPHRLHTVAGMPLMETKGFIRLILIRMEKLTYTCATRVYPNSYQLQEYIKRHICSCSKKLKVIAKGSSNGIDLKHFSDDDELRNKVEWLKDQWRLNDSKVFTFVGRIVKAKGVQELIEAFKSVKTQDPTVKLLLIGSQEKELDPLAKDIKDFIEESPDILALGFQKDVRPYLLMSDVFVFPSYREGFPNVLLQASAFSIPSIASDINGCNEIITHQENGLLIPPKNIEELAKAMLLLTNNENVRRTYGAKAKDFVSQHYEQQYVWTEILHEYKALISKEKIITN